MSTAPIPSWDLADRLHKSLRVSGVSVQAMADELGVHRNTVSGYLSGKHLPTRAVLVVWALKTGTPFEWVAHGEPPVVTGGYPASPLAA